MILSLQNSRRFDPTPFAVPLVLPPSSLSSLFSEMAEPFIPGRWECLNPFQASTKTVSDESARARSEEVHWKFSPPYWKWHLAHGIRARRRFSPQILVVVP